MVSWGELLMWKVQFNIENGKALFLLSFYSALEDGWELSELLSDKHFFSIANSSRIIYFIELNTANCHFIYKMVCHFRLPEEPVSRLGRLQRHTRWSKTLGIMVKDVLCIKSFWDLFPSKAQGLHIYCREQDKRSSCNKTKVNQEVWGVKCVYISNIIVA